MSGSTVHARAIISATDNASAVFRQVAAAGQHAMRSLQQANGVMGQIKGNFTGIAHKMQSTAALSMAMPSALSIGSLGHNQYEWDRAFHTFDAITEIKPDAIEGLKKSIIDVSNATGASATEVATAAKVWVELGNAPATFIENAKVAAKTSRIVGVSVAEQMKESSALLRAFKGSDWHAADFKHYEEVYMVAAKGMKGGAHAYGEAMSKWAPVAAALGLTIEQASAFAQTLGGQFEAGKISNSLKSAFMKLAAPTPKAAAALRYAGINEATLYNVDKAKLDPHRMAEGFRGAGLTITPDVEAKLAAVIKSADVSKGTNGLVDGLRTVLIEALGHKTKSGKYTMAARDSAVVQQAILSLVGNAKTGLNTSEFFKQFGPLSKDLAFMTVVFGKQYAPEMMDLLKQAEHYATNLKTITDHTEGALDRKWSIFGDGFAFEWDKVTASWDNLMKSVGGGGVAAEMTGIMQAMSSLFTKMQDVDPGEMTLIFNALAAVAALPVAALAITSLTTVVGALTSPALIAAAAIAALGVGLYEAYQHWSDIKKAFTGDPAAIARLTGNGALDRLLGTGAFDPANTPDHGFHMDDKFVDHDKARLISLTDKDRLDFFGSGKRGSVLSTDRELNLAYNTGGAWRNTYQNLAAEGARETQRAKAFSTPLVRDIDPSAGPRTVDVTGKVQSDVAVTGTVTGKMEHEIHIIAPPGFSADVTRQSGGEISGGLNTGRSMPDTGSGMGHH